MWSTHTQRGMKDGFTCSFSEKKMRHKELLSHCATPTYLKLATDAVPQGKVRLCKQSFHQQPEKPRGKFSQPKHFIFMFKPLKKSLHYVLVFLSLLAILLTTHHPRMGKVPLDPSVLLPRHSPPAALRGRHWWGETGLPQCFSQSTATLTNRNLSICIIYPVFFPENVSHSTAALWWGQQWFGKRVTPLLHSPNQIDLHKASLCMSCHIRYAHNYGKKLKFTPILSFSLLI